MYLLSYFYRPRQTLSVSDLRGIIFLTFCRISYLIVMTEQRTSSQQSPELSIIWRPDTRTAQQLLLNLRTYLLLPINVEYQSQQIISLLRFFIQAQFDSLAFRYRTLKLWMHFIEDMWREVLTELSSLVNPRFSLWFDFINFYRHSRTFMEQSQHFSAFNYRLSAECSSATLLEEMLEIFSWEDDEWTENYSSRHLSYLGNWVMALS